ncbi:MAG: tRNA (adenosine(37)-N6)-dimethylallyltransferase MiaA [Desulfarculaceae bacterium]|jgi:tRNA dimethylallyltransferase
MTAAGPLVVLAGPTAVGKTQVAIALCQRFGAEVVSADSVQIYRGLDIGSAKPTAQEQAQAPHHLIDVVGPEEVFDAARFVDLADRAIAGIQARQKKVLVAGGTGLYIKALLHGLAPAPPVDEKLRQRLRQRWDQEGAEAMHQKLKQLDAEAAQRLHPRDRQRVLRALEVCLQTGRSLSSLQNGHGFSKIRYPHVIIGLDRPRPELNQRIEHRCRQMWDQGLIEEVRGLLAEGVSPGARSLESLGYRHALAVLQGQSDPEQALSLMARDTKAYAKRQLTWFRGLESIHWHSPEDISAISSRAEAAWLDPGAKR